MKKLSYLSALMLFVWSCNPSAEEQFFSSTSDSLLIHSTVSIPEKEAINNTAYQAPGILSCLQNKPQEYTVAPCSDTVINIGARGSRVHIPKNAFVDSCGNLITTPVTIKIVDYTNAAQMSFSQIPMVYYDKSGNEYNFNSAGMFDISGFSLGCPVHIAPNKTLLVDYALTHKDTAINFYKLSAQTGTWKEVQKITPIKIRKKVQPDQKDILFSLTNPRNMNCNLWYDKEGEELLLEDFLTDNYTIPEGISDYLNEPENRYKSFSVLFTYDSVSGQLTDIRADVRNPLKQYDEELVALVKALTPCNYTLLKKKSQSPFKDVYLLSLHNARWAEREVPIENNKLQLERTVVRAQGNLTAGQWNQYIDAGHTYPSIVCGLRVPSFGVYNCDQIYRLGNRVTISAQYIDEKGNPIKGKQLLSLIDLNYNAAFSFSPHNFTCNSKANNVLLLITAANKMYILDKGVFQTLNITKDGEYTFKMREVTDQLKSPQQLAAYLGLNNGV